VVVVIVVIVVMMVRRASAGGVSSRFGIEWRLDQLYMSADAFHHIGDHMVRPDPYAVPEQLDGKVAIAQVPGDADEFAVLVRMDLHQRFRLGLNTNHATIIQQKAVTVPQPHRLWQINQDFGACRRCQNDPAAVAAVEIDQDMVRFAGRIPGAGRQNGRRSHQNRK
jgi:hypothetical protein